MAIPLIPIMIGVTQFRTGWCNGGVLRMLVGLVVTGVAVAAGYLLLSFTVGTGPAIVPALVPYVLVAFAALGFSWLDALRSSLDRRAVPNIAEVKHARRCGAVNAAG